MQFIYNNIIKETTGLLLHGCNCTGKAMHSGVAKSIKNKWPVVYHRFKTVGGGKHLLGMLDIIKINDNLYIGNGYTQQFIGYNKK